MDGKEWERCAPHDPNRCQSSGQGGQCPYKAKEGSKYCSRHSSNTDTLQARAAANMYRLTKYQDRVSEFATHDELKNLRGEIGILRMSLEEIINSCNGDQAMLIAYSGKIADMVVKIRTLLLSCQKLDVQLGNVLDRDKVILIAQAFIELAAEFVPNPEHLDVLGQKMLQRIMEISVMSDPKG